MDLSGKQVLLTGAGGFIGSHLAQRLVEAGARVRALVRYNSRNHWGFLEQLPAAILEEIEIVPGDITDPHSITKTVQGCSVVFHLAALIAIPYSYRAPMQYVTVNCGGTLNLLEAARAHGVEKFIHTSTSETYGTARYVPIDEEHPLQGQSPYEASKIGAAKLAEAYHLSFDLPVVTVRPFNTYGPRQSARAIVPTIITQALCGDTINLGNLEPRRDLTFVSDVVEGFLRAAMVPEAVGQVINLGSGQTVSVAELAEAITQILGKHKTIVPTAERSRPAKSEVWLLECDNRKAKNLLGWQPRTSLIEGLTQTMAYIEAHLQEYKPEIYNI